MMRSSRVCKWRVKREGRTQTREGCRDMKCTGKYWGTRYSPVRAPAASASRRRSIAARKRPGESAASTIIQG
jgi:hypothetical protein